MERSGLGPELGVIVATELQGEHDRWTLEASIGELAALAASAGVTVVGRMTQRLPHPNPATYIGSGKVVELRDAILELGADVALFDRELSPRQQRNLERALDVKVIDRTALILDVFARHARTREGMVQVELAQWQYRLPRLTRMWTHLARQAGGRAGGSSGGVGVRGPGETQIELDRREIGHRIAVLNKEIESLRKHRSQSRRHRRASGMPTVSMVGYTNAGKSTLLNALTQAEAYTADQLFATLDPTTRRLELPSGRTALISDTVGFIQKLPTELVASFRATLEEVAEVDLLVHVIDITHPEAVAQAETVESILRDLGLVDPPMVVAANKIDALPDSAGKATERHRAPGHESVAAPRSIPYQEREAVRVVMEMYPDLVPISARDGEGLDALLAAIDDELCSQLVLIEALVPYTEGWALELAHEHGVVESESYEEDGIRISARLPRRLAGRLAALGQEQGGSSSVSD